MNNGASSANIAKIRDFSISILMMSLRDVRGMLRHRRQSAAVLLKMSNARDPESTSSKEESQLLPEGWVRIRNAIVRKSQNSDTYSTGTRTSSFRQDSMRKERRRAILKNGECNVLKSNISVARELRFMLDIYTTLVDSRWRWTLFVFFLSFIGLWLIFGGFWYLIVWAHGDLEEQHLPSEQEARGWKPCLLNVDSYASCFLFSVETQFTIGYGLRVITEECPEAIFIMCVQCIVGTLLTTYTVGVVFAKMTRPKHRTQTLLFSKCAVVCQRDGELCLMFRVGDIGKSNIIGASVRAQLLKSHRTKEGEIIAQHQTELELHSDGCDSDLFFIWPTTVVHRINSDSPLYEANVLQERFEIVVILEGTIESTAQSTQARSSYTTNEIVWGHRFVPMVQYNKKKQCFEADYSKFDETVPVKMPFWPGKELDELYDVQFEKKPIENAEGVTLRFPEGASTDPKQNYNDEVTVVL